MKRLAIAIAAAACGAPLVPPSNTAPPVDLVVRMARAGEYPPASTFVRRSPCQLVGNDAPELRAPIADFVRAHVLPVDLIDAAIGSGAPHRWLHDGRMQQVELIARSVTGELDVSDAYFSRGNFAGGQFAGYCLHVVRVQGSVTVVVEPRMSLLADAP